MAGEVPRHFYLQLERDAEKRWTVRGPTAKSMWKLVGPLGLEPRTNRL
jgi:hypothetical protein